MTLAIVGMFASGLTGSAQAQDASPAPTATPTPTPTPTPEPSRAFEIYPKGQYLGAVFTATIEAGATGQLTIVLADTGDVVFKGRTYAANAFNTVNGGFGVADSGTPPVGVTTWLDYPEKLYTLDPKKGIERAVDVKVPAGTEPGEYITALVLEDAEARAIAGSQNFQQQVRFAIPVIITVPGPIKPGLSVGAISLSGDASAPAIDIEIVNSGNVRLRPSGTVTVSTVSGTPIYDAPVGMGAVFPRASAQLVVGLPKPLPAGDYRIAVNLTDSTLNVSAKAAATVTATAPATPVAPPTIGISVTAATPQPDAARIQFLEIAAVIDNAADPRANLQVVLHVTHDGQPVEDFTLASSLSAASGETAIASRYIPAKGWSPGVWQFSLSLDAAGSGGVAEVLAATQLPNLTIP